MWKWAECANTARRRNKKRLCSPTEHGASFSVSAKKLAFPPEEIVFSRTNDSISRCETHNPQCEIYKSQCKMNKPQCGTNISMRGNGLCRMPGTFIFEPVSGTYELNSLLIQLFSSSHTARASRSLKKRIDFFGCLFVFLFFP